MRSESIRTLKRFTRNKPALIAVVVLALLFLAAIFAYVLAPDNTPNANEQTPELQGMPPGYRQTFIAIPSSEKRKNQLPGWLAGYPANRTLIPVTDYTFHQQSISFQQYIDEDTSVSKSINIEAANPPYVVEKTYLLGTDPYGRDILSRLLVGLRISIGAGLTAMLLSLLIGITLGAVAGYFGGRTDAVLMWLIQVMWAIPAILLAFAFTITLGKGFFQIFLAVGLTLWVPVARLVRGQVMAVKEWEFVQAARALGYTHSRILQKHILPNVMAPVWVQAAANFASAIMIEAGLSFLGIGVQPPQPSLGLMLREHYTFLITNRPLLAITPGLLIMIIVLCINLAGNGLRDALDTRN